MEVADFRVELGSIGFTVGALDKPKPFLFLLYAWVASVDQWSASGKCLFRGLWRPRCGTARRSSTQRGDDGREAASWFRADAKAEGQSVAIGAWECLGGTNPPKRDCSPPLLTKIAPWAPSRGESFRSIAAIELFASFASLTVFTKNEKDCERCVLHVTGLTDNSGNTSALSRFMSPMFLLVVIMTEWGHNCRQRGLKWTCAGFLATRTKGLTG